MFIFRERRREVVADVTHDVGHFVDGVFTALGLRGVDGATTGGEGEPERAFVGDDGVEARGLARDDEIEPLLSGECDGAVLTGFLAAQSGETNFVAERGQHVAQFAQRPKHRSHRAFGVARASAPDFAVAQFAAKGVYAHASDADGVGVRREEEARLCASAITFGEGCEDVWTTGQHVAQFDACFCKSLAEPADEPFGDGLLAGVWRAGFAFGIHARDLDERLEQGAGGFDFHAANLRWKTPRLQCGAKNCPKVYRRRCR